MKPNIILIYPDSLTAHALGCYGNPNDVSPVIDKLASEGVRFTNCISANPVCQPSRASLHTGCYVTGHNVRNNGTEELDPVYPTIAKEFGKAGYRCAYYGKTHSVNQEEWDDVFDLYPDYNRYLKGRGSAVAYPERPPVADLCAGISAIPDEDFSENILGNIADRFIRDMAGKKEPFLLFMSHEAPHSPWTIPEKYKDFLSTDDIALPEIPDDALESKHPELKAYLEKRAMAADTDEKLKYAIKIYQTLIKIVDNNVEKLLKALEETGQRDNTIIIITSDHGDHLGNYRSLGKCISSADNLLRVPLIVNYPKRWSARVDDNLVQNVDLFPTLAELAGIAIPSGVQGKSMVELFDNGQTVREYAFSEEHYDHFDSWMVAQDKRWKLVYYSNGRQELYDLDNDPYEWKNLAGNSDVVEHISRLKDELLKWRFTCTDRKTPERGCFVKDFMKPGFFRY